MSPLQNALRRLTAALAEDDGTLRCGSPAPRLLSWRRQQWSATMKANSQSALSDPAAIAYVGYDECVERLAYTIDHRDEAELEEVAYLISRLAFVIE
jgi:hypothetical protein